jgi:UDP-N-acetyl-D-mannosaminuronate dehydrogenase
VGDARESPVEVFMEKLQKRDAGLHLIDPYIEDSYLNRFGKVEKDVYRAHQEHRVFPLKCPPCSQ